MHLMYFKTAIIIQMASSLVLGASSSSILGAFFCHSCGNAWMCLVLSLMRYLGLLLCTFTPTGNRIFLQGFLIHFWQKLTLWATRLCFPGLVSLSPFLLVWKRNTLIFGGKKSLLWVSSTHHPQRVLEENLSSWSDTQKYHLHHHGNFIWLHSFI